MLFRTICLVGALVAAAPCSAQIDPQPPTTVRLYPNGAPGSETRRKEPEEAKDYWVKNIHDPSLTVYRPEPGRGTGTAIIVLPGGGHGLLVIQGEGVKAAEVLNRMGITVFVLKYRLARETGSTYSIEGDAAGDTARAVQWVRANAAQHGVDPKRIGLMGFSAGSELVSLVANYPGKYAKAPNDKLSSVSARPDFQVLVYPGPLAVKGPVPASAPPGFLVAGSKDQCCAAPTGQLYGLLASAGVSAELHMFAEAGHGFNMDRSSRISVARWSDRLFDWLFDNGWLGDRRTSTR